MRVGELFHFVRERYLIWVRRFTKHQPKPWTDDPILQSYRFCNVYRELDTETIWIAQNWRQPYKSDPDLWFAMVVARMFNWHPTLKAIGYPVPFNPAKMLKAVRALEGKVFTGAYMIRAEPARPGEGKLEYLVEDVFHPMWKARKQLRPRPGYTLAMYHEELSQYFGMGSFMAGQVVADLKYAQMRSAKDWWSWAAMGPGSARGLSRMNNLNPTEFRWDQESWLETLQQLSTKMYPLIRHAKMPRMHNQDLQNCLCEFDKYERVRLGEGRPRSLYPGK